MGQGQRRDRRTHPRRPHAERQHDERAVQGVDGRGRGPAPAGEGRDHRGGRHQREEDLLRRRRPEDDGPGGAGGRTPDLRDRRGDQGGPASPRAARQARRRRDQRRRARRRPRDHPGLPPPDRGRRPLRPRPARGVARPAARRRRRDPARPDVRHVRRPHDLPAHRHQAEAGPGEGEGPRRRGRRDPGGAGPGREGVDPRERGQRRGREPALGPSRLQDAGRRPVEPEGRGGPPRLPGQPAQAGQGCRLPRAEGHHVGGRRGRPGGLRHRVADRVALPDQAGHRVDLEEHDPGVLLRPAGDQLRLAAARRASTSSPPRSSVCSAPG